jgi:hypothetical protein
MNINQKKLKLIKEGIKASTLNKMTDSQVVILFSKLQEQVQQSQSATTITTVGPQGGSVPVKPGQQSVNLKPVDGGKFVANEEKEIDEKFESKKQQKLFFAKCNDKSLSKKEQNKWCKMADEFSKDTIFAKLPEKKETKEGYSDMIQSAYTKVMKNKLGQMSPTPSIGESKIERQILKLVEKHITPKMTKQEFLNLFEGDTKTAPTKPKVKPGTKPGKDSPYKPKPGIKPAPKAKKSLPSWLSFDSLGLNLKG